jgi:hypothetical protein
MARRWLGPRAFSLAAINRSLSRLKRRERASWVPLSRPVPGLVARMGTGTILPLPGINPRETPLRLHVLQD